jgi:hypothetical protein
MKAFQEFIQKEGARPNPNYAYFEDACSAVLQYFKLSAQFDSAWKEKLQAEVRKKQRQEKWNGMHIMSLFQIEGKKVNALKKQFESIFSSRAEYENYVEQTPFE